jgi:hypothetical protein
MMGDYLDQESNNKLPLSKAGQYAKLVEEFHSQCEAAGVLPGSAKAKSAWKEYYVPLLPESMEEHMREHKLFSGTILRQQFKHLKEKPVSYVLAHREIPSDYRPEFLPGDMLYDQDDNYYLNISDVIRRSSAKGNTLTIKLNGYQSYPLNTDAKWAAFRKTFQLVKREVLPGDPCARYDIPTRTWVQQQIDQVRHDAYTAVRGSQIPTRISDRDKDEIARKVYRLVEANTEIKKKRRWFW